MLMCLQGESKIKLSVGQHTTSTAERPFVVKLWAQASLDMQWEASAKAGSAPESTG